MSKKSFSNGEPLFKENNPSSFLKYLDYLEEQVFLLNFPFNSLQGSDDDYIDNVSNLMNSLQNPDLMDIDYIKRIVQHCLKASGKLFLQSIV